MKAAGQTSQCYEINKKAVIRKLKELIFSVAVAKSYLKEEISSSNAPIVSN
jgi:membrane carboxypeptidase/penicillin-binding protein